MHKVILDLGRKIFERLYMSDCLHTCVHKTNWDQLELYELPQTAAIAMLLLLPPWKRSRIVVIIVIIIIIIIMIINNCIQRHNSRFFTISSLRHELSPTCTL